MFIGYSKLLWTSTFGLLLFLLQNTEDWDLPSRYDQLYFVVYFDTTMQIHLAILYFICLVFHTLRTLCLLFFKFIKLHNVIGILKRIRITFQSLLYVKQSLFLKCILFCISVSYQFLYSNKVEIAVYDYCTLHSFYYFCYIKCISVVLYSLSF